MDYSKLMRQAIELARAGIAAGESPFAALIATQDGRTVCAVHNVVRATCDITAHAEVHAVRRACHELGTVDLSGHIIVTTCEPCPMCASAIHWARLDTVVYGAAIEDAERAGFHELRLPIESLYEQGGGGVRVVSGVCREACCALFDEWRRGPAPTPY